MKHQKGTWFEILHTSLFLGLTSFGGPVAHLGYFKQTYVDQRKWLDDKTYADIIALCQFLPGPTSSQVGMAIGMVRGGLWGGILSWFGFTIPSIIFLVAFAMLYQNLTLGDATWIASLKVVAVSVVAHAVINLGKKLTPDQPRIALAVLSAVIILLFPSSVVQVIIILSAAMIGYFLFSKQSNKNRLKISLSVTKRQGIYAFALFAILLIGLPMASALQLHPFIDLFDTFYRVGSLVFGGGHVVLPLLESEVVPAGWVHPDEFLAGYGLAQAVPGPLFTFASYLGALISGTMGALITTVAIFLPSFLLIIGTLPFLTDIRNNKKLQGMLVGVNASVVGILLAALYDPVFTTSIHSGIDLALAVILFSLLHFFKVRAWIIVLIGIGLGQIFSLMT